ncbi:hypothetical protein [Streptomyces sp. WMMB 322]|uniref:hypothetical protein n=1 Tax=Streptomyces sp. WMMB 322 TaxID=1286821 RepID=UPI0009436FDF|nr:hypothetical protein [Streptomyces sp. WMMB 322]
MADVSAATARPPLEPVGEYAAELAALAGRLDAAAGWYAVFAAHDPQGLRDCLAGREVPPWDVVASLLEDFTRLYGTGPARRAEERLLRLHAAATAAYDVWAGGAPALRSRLAVLEGESAEAAARVRALEADGGPELAWALDHLARTESRRAELRARHAALGASTREGPAERDEAERNEAERNEAERDETERAVAPEHHGPASAPAPNIPAHPNRRARTGGSRFAGAPLAAADAAGPAAIVPPGAPSPDLVTPVAGNAGAAAAGEPPPRGARFAGAVRRPAAAVPAPEEVAEARAAEAETAARLTHLRRAGSGGEAHALLCEAAGRQPLRFAVLVEELHRRGMTSDAGILLWEAAALPAGAFAAAAGALCSLGRTEDGARLLRQGAHRPPQEVAEAALALHRAGRESGAVELLAAVIRARSPSGAAEVVSAAPAVSAAAAAPAAPSVLVPLVLDAAGTLSPEHRRRVADALRAAGVPGVPGAV